MSLFEELVLATAMVTLTTVLHLCGLGVLLAVLRRADRDRVHLLRRAASLGIVAVALFALHAVEIWSYAALFFGCGATASLEEALYFSTSSFTTVGYGDVTLSRGWRIIGAIESANGIILLGWSTAFFVSVVNRLRVLEQEIEQEL